MTTEVLIDSVLPVCLQDEILSKLPLAPQKIRLKDHKFSSHP